MKRFYSALGLLLLLLLWELGHRVYGPLVMPSLGETARTLGRMVRADEIGPALVLTAVHAGTGWLIAGFLGTLAGLAAGRRTEIRLALQPVAVVLLGMPAIAWVVLALLWFGGDWAVIFTVAIATGPVVFTAALAGARSLDGDLARMARAFQAPALARAWDVYLPHMAGHLFPALATTLAMSWKVSVMAELLSGAGGIGDGIAGARARVDTAETMAWILVILIVLIALDHLVLRRFQRHVELWRYTGRDSDA